MAAAEITHIDGAEVSFKDAGGGVVSTSWIQLDANAVVRGRPWRNFPWYLGQRNYSGRYWCATESRLVEYESRVELSRLMMLDFDRTVQSIASQPFWLRAKIAGRWLRRVPDYLACTDQGPLVVDVTRAKKMTDPEFCRTLILTRQIVESRGWRYEVLHEPPRIEFLNVRFLAGYRRTWLFRAEVLDAVRDTAQRSGNRSIDEIVTKTKHSRPVALAAAMHLLWRQEFTFDLTTCLQPSTMIEVRA